MFFFINKSISLAFGDMLFLLRWYSLIKIAGHTSNIRDKGG